MCMMPLVWYGTVHDACMACGVSVVSICVRRIGGGVASKTRIKGKPLIEQLYATAALTPAPIASYGLCQRCI